MMAASVQPEPDERTIRAVTEYMSVLEIGHALFEVVSESGNTYIVDLVEPACTCADFTYRDSVTECKHIRATRLAVGQLDLSRLVEEFEERANELEAQAARLIEQATDREREVRRLRAARARLEEGES